MTLIEVVVPSSELLGKSGTFNFVLVLLLLVGLADGLFFVVAGSVVGGCGCRDAARVEGGGGDGVLRERGYW